MSALYVHIPYCIQKCLYCDFCSGTADAYKNEYARLVVREIELTAEKMRKKGESIAPATSVFFGGGTPTVLSSKELIQILQTLQANFPFAADAEISIECNPATATQAELSALCKAGFNRISIGLQSADDALLARIGRAHSSASFLQTLQWARAAGFANINADVMHGLPGQTQENYLDTLQRVCDLELPHISAYALILEKDTPLYKLVEIEQTETLPSADAVADMQDAGMAYLAERGYARYEVSNFAKPGFACRHNLVYWNNEAYLGFGVAAHSSVPGKKDVWLRYANEESTRSYAKKVERGALPIAETIKLYASEQMFESIMLGLRKTEGIHRESFRARYGMPIEQAFPKAVAEAAEYGWWAEDDAYLRLTTKGMDMLNTVLTLFR